jgi:hypothetical protein
VQLISLEAVALNNAVETISRMNTDYQSNTKLRAIISKVSGFDPDFVPELFLYPWRSGKSVVKLIGCDCGI